MKLNARTKQCLEEAVKSLEQAQRFLNNSLDAVAPDDEELLDRLKHEEACIKYRIVEIRVLLFGQKRAALRNRLQSLAAEAEAMADNLGEPGTTVAESVDISDLESELEALSTEYEEAVNESE
jgi:hypothetical protein